MGDFFISALTKSCRLGLKSKFIGHLSGCIEAMCTAKRVELTSTDSSDEGSRLLSVTLYMGEAKENLPQVIHQIMQATSSSVFCI